MATMNISLPDALKAWVEEQVRTGRYGNSSDYVRDLVRRDQERADAREKLQQMVDEALASGIVEISREDLLARMMEQAQAAIDARKEFERLIEEGLASGVSDLTVDEVFANARRRALAGMKHEA